MISAAWIGDWPVTQPYGPTELEVEPWYKGQHFHCGIDIGMRSGTPLRAIRGGIVSAAGRGILGIKTASGETDFYIHGRYPRLAAVAKGQAIGVSGAVIPSGGSLDGPHLHFERQGPGGWLNNPGTSRDPGPILFPELYGPDGKLITGGFDNMTDAQISALFDNIRQNQVGDRNAILKALGDLTTAIKGVQPSTGGLTPVQSKQLDDIAAFVTAVKAVP